MQSQAATVPAYLKELDEQPRKALATLRKLIRRVAPQAKEGMRYGMPYYEWNGPLFSLAAQKHYLALYVCDVDLDKIKAKLGKTNCGKGCIRFKKLDDLNLEALEQLLADVTARHSASE